jgi:hypothetical protein
MVKFDETNRVQSTGCITQRQDSDIGCHCFGRHLLLSMHITGASRLNQCSVDSTRYRDSQWFNDLGIARFEWSLSATHPGNAVSDFWEGERPPEPSRALARRPMEARWRCLRRSPTWRSPRLRRTFALPCFGPSYAKPCIPTLENRSRRCPPGSIFSNPPD